MSSLFDLSGKVAIVTGSTKGIGEAIVRRMAEHGARVVVSSRKADNCETVAASIQEAHGKDSAMAVACNISKKEDLQALVNKTIAAWGRLDILVCNAAVNPFFGSSQDIPDEAFDRILSSNIKSNHWLCQMVVPTMQKQKDGVIILISSIAGLQGSPVLGTYGVSKAADLQLARNLAVEFGPDNIRANCIAPGLIKTYFSTALWSDENNLKRTTATTPLRRIGVPDEIAGAAVFLASPSGRFTTGHKIVIDGGVTIA